MENLLAELKTKIVKTLNLVDVTADEIDVEAPMVGGELEIDSIDILELVIMIEKDYGVTIDNKELGEKVFTSIRTLADYIGEKSSESVH